MATVYISYKTELEKRINSLNEKIMKCNTSDQILEIVKAFEKENPDLKVKTKIIRETSVFKKVNDLEKDLHDRRN